VFKLPILVLLFLSAATASSVYTSFYNGPIIGNLSNPNFIFSHTSDWQSTSNQIINTLKNDHKAPLVASWPDAGIFEPIERKLPSGKSDTNSYSCPPKKLSANLSAQLFYGLGYTPKTAGVYMLSTTAAAIVDTEEDQLPLTSKISISTQEEPYTLEVTSKMVKKGTVEYIFTQNRPFYFLAPLPLSADAFRLPAGGRVEVSQPAFEKIRLPPPVKEKIANLADYKFFWPQSLTSIATITSTAKPFRVVPVLLFIANKDHVLQGSGYVTVHLP
jgi:hypothetical protein